MNILNNNGPKLERCGIPRQQIAHHLLCEETTLVLCFLELIERKKANLIESQGCQYLIHVPLILQPINHVINSRKQSMLRGMYFSETTQ